MKEIKPGYYRDNFLKLALFVEETYGDILNEREASFLDRFRKLSLGAQCLYVRLISRKGPLFRLFPDRQALDNALAYHRTGELFRERREAGDLTGEELVSLAEGLPEPGENYFLIRRRDRLVNELAREMERRNLADRALEFYGRSAHAPARERRIRLLFRREKYGPCLSLLKAILEDPENEEEREFALFFQGKVTKRLTGQSLPRKKPAWPSGTSSSPPVRGCSSIPTREDPPIWAIPNSARPGKPFSGNVSGNWPRI